MPSPTHHGHTHRGRKKHRSKPGSGTSAGVSPRRIPSHSTGTEDEIDAATFLLDQISPEAALARRIAAGEGERHETDEDEGDLPRRPSLPERVKRASTHVYAHVSRFVRNRPARAAATGLALVRVLGRHSRHN